MWYDSLMPHALPTKELAAAEAAVVYAQQTRKRHARRTERASPQRAEAIEIALERIGYAMAPIRSLIGAFPYGPQTDAAEANRRIVREASLALQRERRKLHKMKAKS